LATEGQNTFTYYPFRNIYTYISQYDFQNHYMLIGKYIRIFHILFVTRNFRGSLHAHLSKCWRGTWAEKVW